MRAIFDTNILIDHLNAIAAASKEIALYQSPMISQITWMEVMAGADSEVERKILRPFLASFEIVQLTIGVMEKAALLKAESKLKLPDAIILASALVNNLILVTRDTKAFKQSQWPNIRVPYELS